MSDTKPMYTPGPWTLTRSADRFVAYANASSWRKFAEVVTRNPSIAREESEANARLIAASPRMFEAIAAVLERSGGRLYETDQRTGETFDALLREAIAGVA